jgi:hypothetical protein
MKRLEAIVHPLVHAQRLTFLQQVPSLHLSPNPPRLSSSFSADAWMHPGRGGGAATGGARHPAAV